MFTFLQDPRRAAWTAGLVLVNLFCLALGPDDDALSPPPPPVCAEVLAFDASFAESMADGLLEEAVAALRLAAEDPAAFMAAHPDWPIELADVNGDGAIDPADAEMYQALWSN
ncbi:MAG: hypothetical protein AB1716_15740 [Planctomycetota bacterium]